MNRKTLIILSILLFLLVGHIKAAWLMIPMDNTQKNHLKAYGIAYWVLEKGVEIQWLLNYRGGSYLMPYNELFDNECTIRGVTSMVLTDVQASSIKQQIMEPDVNMDIIDRSSMRWCPICCLKHTFNVFSWNRYFRIHVFAKYRPSGFYECHCLFSRREALAVRNTLLPWCRCRMDWTMHSPCKEHWNFYDKKNLWE